MPASVRPLFLPPHPVARIQRQARAMEIPQRPGCGRGGSAGGRGGLGYGGGFGLVIGFAPSPGRAQAAPPRSSSCYQAHHERTVGQYSTTRGQAVPQIRTTMGTAIKIVRAVMTQVSQRVVAVCRSVAAWCLSIATRRRSTASLADHWPRGMLSAMARHPVVRSQRQVRRQRLRGVSSSAVPSPVAGASRSVAVAGGGSNSRCVAAWAACSRS
jgi:hypothetical protein